MTDVVFEWYIPYVPNRREMLLKALFLSAAAVLLFDVLFFAAGLWPLALGFAAAGFFYGRSLRYEYEYVYVNGDFDISKIIRKEKRKDVYHVNRPDMETFVRGRMQAEGKKIRDFTSGRPGAEVYTIQAKGELVFIEPSEEFVEEMRKYYHG